MDDVRAVLDAVGSRQAALLGVSEGGPLCALYATTYPERTRALVMIGTYAKRRWAPDYPWAPTDEQGERFLEEIQRTWGGPVGLEARAPTVAADPAFRDWWSTYLRMGASPGAALALTRMNAAIDVRDVLPAIRVPTLILHRTEDRLLTIDEGRYVASLIPGATLIELPGEDHLPFVGDQDAMLDAHRALPRPRARRGRRRPRAGDHRHREDRRGRTPAARQAFEVAGAGRHRPPARPPAGVRRRRRSRPPSTVRRGRSAAPRRWSRRARGRTARCGPACTPASASWSPARCAASPSACRATWRRSPGAGEVLVSRTLVDLVAGSGLEFESRGPQPFGANGDRFEIFAVRAAGRLILTEPLPAAQDRPAGRRVA